jgi:hypothetical protein
VCCCDLPVSEQHPDEPDYDWVNEGSPRLGGTIDGSSPGFIWRSGRKRQTTVGLRRENAVVALAVAAVAAMLERVDGVRSCAIQQRGSMGGGGQLCLLSVLSLGYL